MLACGSSSFSPLIRDIAVVRLSLFGFLSPMDATRLLATCQCLRNDTDNVDLLLQFSPVTSVVFHSRDISPLGCWPLTPRRPLHTASAASAFSVATLWEQELLPLCYQWHHGRRMSMRLEPFMLPLPARVQSIEDVHNALEDVLEHLGDAFLTGRDLGVKTVSLPASDPLHKDSVTSTDVDTEEEETGDHTAFSSLLDSDSEDDSAWSDSDSDSDDDSDAEMEDDLTAKWFESVASSSLEPRLYFTLYRPLLSLFQTHGFQLARRVVVPLDASKDTTWQTHLIVGVAPSGCALGGILLKGRPY